MMKAGTKIPLATPVRCFFLLLRRFHARLEICQIGQTIAATDSLQVNAYKSRLFHRQRVKEVRPKCLTGGTT